MPTAGGEAADVVDSGPARRSLLVPLLVACVVAAVAVGVAARVWSSRDGQGNPMPMGEPLPAAPPGRVYVQPTGAQQSSVFDGEYGYIASTRSVWPGPFDILRVVPVDARGIEVEHRLAAADTSSVRAQQVLYGFAEASDMVTVPAAADVDLALRVRPDCAGVVPIVALRVLIVVDGHEAEQVVPLGPRGEAKVAQLARGLCASPAPRG